MRLIEGNTIGELHERAVKEIVFYGIQQETKHGITLEHPEGLDLKIKFPFKEPIKSSAYKLSMHALEFYATQLLSIIPKTGTNKDFDYNCGNRWQDYFDFSEHGIIGDGDFGGFNQLEYMIIQELKNDSTSRRAVMSSIFPPIDITKQHIPCISFLQFLIREGQLNLIVYIRSNDMLSAWGADAYALSKLLELVSNKLQIKPGYLETLSISAHIYYKRDAEELKDFRRKFNL